MSFSEDDSGNQTKYRNITVIEPSEEIRNALELNSSDKVIESAESFPGMESGDEKTAHTLQCELSDPLLVIYRYFIDQDGRCIGFGKKYMRQNYGRLKASSGYFEPC